MINFFSDRLSITRPDSNIGSTYTNHLRIKLLDKNLQDCKFLIPNLTISLQHCCAISLLCKHYKIFHNPSHSLHSELPNSFFLRRITKGSLSVNSLSFTPMSLNTSKVGDVPEHQCGKRRVMFLNVL